MEAATESDIVGRAKASLIEDQKGPFAHAYPYTPLTDPILQGLADLRPTQLALMHGSAFVGDGERALRDLATTLREVLGRSTGNDGQESHSAATRGVKTVEGTRR